MIAGINIYLISTVVVLLVFYLLRRRTRVVTTELNVSTPSDTQSSESA